MVNSLLPIVKLQTCMLEEFIWVIEREWFLFGTKRPVKQLWQSQKLLKSVKITNSVTGEGLVAVQ